MLLFNLARGLNKFWLLPLYHTQKLKRFWSLRQGKMSNLIILREEKKKYFAFVYV